VYNYAMGKEPWLEHLLGLGTEEDSPQLRESREMIARSLARGFSAAERPFGKGEIYLRDQGHGGLTDDTRPLKESFAEDAPQTDSAHQTGGEKRLAYWRKQLDSPRAVFALPEGQTDEQAARPARHSVAFSSHLVDALVRFSQQRGYRTALVTLAAFQALLYSYTEQDDLVLGVKAAELVAPEQDFDISETATQTDAPAGTLALRTDLSDEPDFNHLLDRVRGVVATALAHGDVPFESLAHDAGEEIDALRARLFRVMFSYAEEPLQVAPTADELAGGATEDGCRLALVLTRGEGGMVGAVQYDAESFASETIATMLDNYQTVLASLLENPQRIITDISSVGRQGVATGLAEDLEEQFTF
jgi:hypothetical protein